MIAKTEPHTCLVCDRPITLHAELRWNDATHDPNQDPQAGDVAVCYACGAVMIYNTDLSWRFPTLTELNELQEDERLQHLVRFVKMRGDEDE